MAGPKMLTLEEKAAAIPVVQGAMQTYQQHYGLNLTDHEISRVVGMAINALKSTSTSEVHGAVKDQLFAFLMEKDPGRAIDFRMKAQDVPELERGRIHRIAEESGFKAANAELAKLTKTPAEKPPEAAPAQSPMFLDPKHDQEIKRTLDKASTSDFGTPFDQCTPMQKAEILKTVLEAGGKLGLAYDRRMGQKPQTVEEFLRGKSGNCADFSRLLVAVAKEKGLPVQMVSITFQAQDGTREEEQHLAVFNMGDKIYYLDLSNRILRPYSGFASTEDLIKDAGFQRAVFEDYKRAMKDGKEYRIAEEPKLIATEGAYQATYQADLGLYHVQKKEWKAAITAYEKAIDAGLKTHWNYSELSFSYFNTGQYLKAKDAGEEAIKLRENALAFLRTGDAYLKLGQPQIAIDYFQRGLKLRDTFPEMEFDLGTAHLNLGVQLDNSGDHKGAIHELDAALEIFNKLYERKLEQIPVGRIGFQIMLIYENKAIFAYNAGAKADAIRIIEEGISIAKERNFDSRNLDELRTKLK